MIEWLVKFAMSRLSDEELKRIFLSIDRIGIKRFLVSGEQFRFCIQDAEPGDLIMIRAFLEASTAEIDLFSDRLPCGISSYTHVAGYVGDGNICDATKVGFTKHTAYDLLPAITQVFLGRPMLPKDVRSKIAENLLLMSSQKIEYDFRFKKGRDKLYCSEGYCYALNDASPGYFDFRERLGEQTVTPNDYRLAVEKIAIIKEVVIGN